MVDPTFAKKQLMLLVREWYMKPDGQIPAYEWNFSDVNPPVHAWFRDSLLLNNCLVVLTSDYAGLLSVFSRSRESFMVEKTWFS